MIPSGVGAVLRFLPDPTVTMLRKRSTGVFAGLQQLEPEDQRSGVAIVPQMDGYSPGMGQVIGDYSVQG
jgi:hypothetical protein